MVTLHDLKIAVISARHWKLGKVCFRPLILVLGMLTSSEQLNGQAPSIHIPSWTGDCIELAKTWMTDCGVGHESFCSKTVLKPSKPYLPTILLYVGDKVSSELRLEEIHSLGFDLLDFKYLALSYCRSENRLPMTQKLTLDKKDEWKSQINERELPLTFQHAIHLTRQLELNYLWVDVLCIVQDCPEEKKREPESMGKVFVNAHCTIASSEDANGGCFTKRNSSLLDFPCCLRFSKHNALTVRAQGQTHNLESFTKEVDEKNLSWQSWGFQERLLSRRIIHFGPKFLFFECNTHIASQGTSASQPFREKQWLWYRRKPRLHNHAFQTIFNPVNGYRNSFHQLRANRGKTLSAGWEIYLHDRWAELVIRFTKCKTTEPSDRTNSLLGLAQAIQDGDKELGYMHGLWRRHLLFDLLWFIKSGQANKQSEHRTRSWSWQSVHGEVGRRLMSDGNNKRGKERTWSKVAELVTGKDGEDSATSEARVEDNLILKCPLYRCTNIFPSGNQQFILQLQTPEGRGGWKRVLRLISWILTRRICLELSLSEK
jgi:hypothetical protein